MPNSWPQSFRKLLSCPQIQVKTIFLLVHTRTVLSLVARCMACWWEAWVCDIAQMVFHELLVFATCNTQWWLSQTTARQNIQCSIPMPTCQTHDALCMIGHRWAYGIAAVCACLLLLLSTCWPFGCRFLMSVCLFQGMGSIDPRWPCLTPGGGGSRPKALKTVNGGWWILAMTPQLSSKGVCCSCHITHHANLSACRPSPCLLLHYYYLYYYYYVCWCSNAGGTDSCYNV